MFELGDNLTSRCEFLGPFGMQSALWRFAVLTSVTTAEMAFLYGACLGRLQTKFLVRWEKVS